MSWTGWLLFFAIFQIVHGLGTWKMYIAAGRKAIEAFIPVYNAVVLCKIINRPWWYVILLFLPVVNLIMFIVFWVETLRSFGYNRTIDTALGILTLGLYIYYINYTQPLNHIKDRSLHPRTSSGEWTSSILFAVVAATIVHTYVLQPFIIPTSSLEKTLLVGDFLFVSKLNYGPRIPMTPVALPMVHDSIPVIGVKSYLDNPQIPYTRIPGFTKPKKNDIVVFNWPADTIWGYPSVDGKYHYKPIDKKSNYVKRCVAVAGDTLSIKDGVVYIDGEELQLPERAKLQYSYLAETKGRTLDPSILKEKYDITEGFQQGSNRETDKPAAIFGGVTDEAAVELIKEDNIVSLEKEIMTTDMWHPSMGIFPYDGKIANNTDQFSPMLIPAKGMTTPINVDNIAYYKGIIELYEGEEMGIDNKVTVNGKRVFLNGKPLTSYTFKQNYYWLMGDNRHRSLDSRSWGFVPENHVVGTPVFVWMSMDWSSFPPSIRLNRLFTFVYGDGQPRSYFLYFVIALGGFIVYRKIRKNKKANKKK